MSVGAEGQTIKAEYFLNRAIESDPTLVEAYLNLGLVLATEGKLPAALRAEDKALATSPKDAGAQAAKNAIEIALQHAAAWAASVSR